MNPKLIFLIQATLLCLAFTSRIVPDVNNPLFLTDNQARLLNQTLSLTFTFNSESNRLKYSHYFGVDLSSIEIELFKTAGFKCNLKDEATSEFFYIEAILPVGVESSKIGYCKFTDTERTLNIDTKYTLSLYFASMNDIEDITFIPNVSLFTLVDLDADAMEIDSSLTFGSMATYSNYSSSTPALSIITASSSVKVSAGSSTSGSLIYKGDEFTVNLAVETYQKIMKDAIILIEFDENYFTGPTQAVSTSFDTTSELHSNIKGSLSLTKMTDYSYKLENISQDLVKGRKANLNLKGWTAKEATVTNSKVILKVLHPNTSSVISYSAASILTVNPVKVTSTIKVLNNPSIFSSAAWPLEFTLSFNVDLDNFFVMLENTYSTKQRINFISSTCDFSDSGVSSMNGASIDKEPFSQIGKCFPMHFTPQNSDTGSNATFFKVPRLHKNIQIKLRVWVFAEKCGSSFNMTSVTDTSIKASFKIKLFNKIDAGAQYDNRFDTTLPSFRPSSKTRLHYEKKEYETQSANYDAPVIMLTESVISDENSFDCFNSLRGLSAADAEQHSVVDKTETTTLIYRFIREITDFEIRDFSRTISAGNYVFQYKDSTSSAILTPSLSIQSSSRAYLFENSMEGKFPGFVSKMTVDNAKPFEKSIPSDKYMVTDNEINGPLEVYFSKRWFKTGNYQQSEADITYDNFCYLSWQLKNDINKDAIDFSYPIEYNTATAGDQLVKFRALSVDVTTKEDGSNIITQIYNTASIIKSTLDINSSILTEGTDTYYSIVGYDNIHGAGPTYYRYRFNLLDTTNPAATTVHFGLFTTCLKWNDVQTSRYLFDNLEVTFVLKDRQRSTPARILRMNSFVTLGGVFSNPSSTKKADDAISSGLKVGTYSANRQSICVTTISNSLLEQSVFSDSANRVLLLSFFNIFLFDTDYESSYADYPVIGLKREVRSFGFNTSLPVTAANYRVDNDLYATAGTIFNTAGTSRQIEMLLFSSQVWITPVSSPDSFTLSDSSSIVIPHYCQEDPSAVDDANIGATSKITAALSISWLKADSFAEINSMSEVIAGNTLQQIELTNIANPTFYYINWMFSDLRQSSQYMVTDNNSVNPNTAPNITNPEAIIFLFSNDVYFKDLNAFDVDLGENLTSSYFAYMSQKGFYFLGQRYTRSLICNFTYKAGETKNFGVSKFRFGGIYRPPLSEMIQDGSYTYANQVATATVSAAGTYLMHNLYLSGTGSAVKPAEAVFSLETSSFTWDSRYDESKVEIYKNDNYSNSVEAVILAPAEIPSGTLLKIKLLDANHLKNISKCAVKSDLSSTASNCSQTVNDEGKYFFECPVREERLRQITVCCYNLGAKDSLMVEEVSLLTQPDPRNIPSNTILFTSSLFQKYTKAVNEKPDANPAKLLGMEYLTSNSENSLSELKIMVDTGRKMQVDYVFEIDGDFRQLVPEGKTIECSASFNQDQNRIGDWEGGDSQLKNCSIIDFDTANGKIKVEAKDFIFNCSTDFKTTLNIYLSPVKVTKFDTSKELTLKTYMKFFQQSLLTFSRPRFPEVKTVAPVEFVDYNQEDFIAQIVDAFPVFSTSTKKITISINLEPLQAFAEKHKRRVNVLILDLNKVNFGELEDKDYFCRDPNNKRVVHCYSKINKLYIHLISTYYEDTLKFSLEIVDIPFFIQLVSFDLEVAEFTAENTVVSVGRGRGRVNINLYPSNEEYAGKLFFINEHSQLVRSNPRFLTSFQLAFKIDDFLSFHSDTHNLGRKPKLIVELPPSYSVPNNSDKKVSLLLEKVLIKEATIGKEVEELEAPVMVRFTDTIVPFGNFLVLDLSDPKNPLTTDFVPDSKLSHYKLDLQNIMAPSEEMDNSGIINIYLTNDNYSKIYRTYSNTVNLTQNDFGTNIIYAYRGFAFKFAEFDWVLDFYENDKRVNHLKVISGFYSEYSIDLRYRGQSTTASGSAELQIVRESYSPFFLRAAGDGLDERVMVSSSINRVNFEIGCTCSTTPGRYLAKFALANKKGSEGEFAMEVRIPVTVTFKPEKLDCGFTTLQIPLSYIVEFSCSITKKVVELFYPEFKNTNSNDNTVLSFVKFDEEQKQFSFRFTASFYNEIGLRIYEGIPNTKCAYFPNTFEFNLAIIAVEGVKSSDLDNVFYSSNGKFDTSLNQNDIKIAYLPEKPYSYMKCAIYCGKEPGDAVVKDQIDNNKSTDLRLFYRYVEVAQESSYVFSGLNRNVEYSLKCFVEDSVNTKDAILQKNTFSKIIIDMNEGSKAGDIAPIRANPTLDTKCIEFSLDKVKTDKFKQAVVDKCQALITLGSLNAAGCLICTDSNRAVLSEGSTLNSNLCNLVEETVIPVKNDTLDTKFSLCVVQDPRCPSTITPDEFTIKFNSVFNFFETNKKNLKDLLKINETYTYSLQTVNDSAISTITTDNFTLNSLEINFSGSYTFELTLDQDLDCYYRMRKFYQPVPEASVLKECAATDSYCGRFFAFKDQKVKVNSVNSTKEFYREQTYIVDVACGSKVVYSKHSLSNVFQIGEYKIQALNKTCPMPYLDLNPQRDTECTCRNRIGHTIPQGSEGEYCYDTVSSWLQLFTWTIALAWLA